MRIITRASIITGAVLAAGALTFSASAATAAPAVAASSTISPVKGLPALTSDGFMLMLQLGGNGAEVVGLHAVPGATVTVVQDGTQTVTAKADAKGGWHVVLPYRGFSFAPRQLAISQSQGGVSSPVTNYTAPTLG